MFKIIFMASIIFLLNSCSYKSTITIDQNISGAFKTFSGLNEIFISTTEDVVLFYVHGMGTHESNETSTINFFDKIALEMGFSNKKAFNIQHNLKINNKTVGDITLRTFKGKERDFVLVSLAWSKSMEFVEETLNHSSNPYTDRIAPGNKAMKKFMNDGFGDAILYFNPNYKQTVHSVIEMGIEKAYNIRPKLRGNRNVLVSTSLGSKMIFDIIKAKCEKNEESAYNDFFNNLQQVFMTSNQIPLLDLFSIKYKKMKNEKRSPTLDDMNNIIRFVSKSLKCSPNSREKLPIIAFSDPNDALSYYIDYTELYKEDVLEKIEFINVTISHSKWWWFTYLANPIKAHGGIKTEDHGYKSFVYGSDYFNFKKYKTDTSVQKRKTK